MAQSYQYQSDKLHEIKRTLKNALESYHDDPEQIAELLAFKGQFYNYSINNSMLIHTQNPYSTFVASFRDWNEKGFHVKRGQHGIKVLYPIRTELIEIGQKDGKKQYRRVIDATPEEKKMIESGELKPVVFTRFGVGNVFDISQTDCPPEKYPEIYDMGFSSEQHSTLYQVIKQFSEQKGIHVKESDLQSISLRGDFNRVKNEIRINEKLNDSEKLSTLTHELGHALMHNDPGASKIPTEVKELEADSISIMLQRYVGIELTDSRKRHFAQNYNTCKDIKDFNFEEIFKSVNRSYFYLHKELEPILSSIPKAQKIMIIDPSNEYKKPEDIKASEKISSSPPKRDSKPKQPNAKQDRQDYREQNAAVLDYIKHGVSILTVATDLGFTVQEFGSYYILKEYPHSSRIYPETNSFASFSEQQENGKIVGGSTIDFVMNYGGYNKKEAIQLLKERYVGSRLDTLPKTTPKKPINPAKPKEFKLPEKISGKFTRAFAYLTKTRCLDPSIVKKCVNDRLIYEDNKHNVVFIGKDAKGNAVFATRHTTLSGSDFKRDVAGSRQDIGFFINNHTDKLYTCEAPIDALSIMSMMKLQGKAVEKASYLATCGAGKDAALYTRLRENPQIKEVVLANDNDETGQKANKKIFNRLQKDFPEIRICVLNPKQEKDINDYLCKTVNSPKGNDKGMEVER